MLRPPDPGSLRGGLPCTGGHQLLAGHCVLSRQGDLKGYLRSCRVTESMAPDPLTLQRMACEVACGVLHLHRHNYVHR